MSRSLGVLTDNLETQAWPHDAQPSFENGGVSRKLSFESAADPSPAANRKDEKSLEAAERTKESPPPVVLGPRRPKPRSKRLARRACGVKPKEAGNKPEASIKPPEPADEAHKPLPTKPACMMTMKPTLSPEEQQPAKPKGRAKKNQDEDEDEDEEREEQEEADDEEDPEHLDGEELEEEEQEEGEQTDEPAPMKRPAAKTGKQQESGKAQSKSKGKSKGKSQGEMCCETESKGKGQRQGWLER